jgi:hypothetical protein
VLKFGDPVAMARLQAEICGGNFVRLIDAKRVLCGATNASCFMSEEACYVRSHGQHEGRGKSRDG